MHGRIVAGMPILLFLLLVTAPTAPCEVMSAESMTPLARVASTPKGQLTSPYADYATVAAEGHRKYMAAGCNGCGMAAPLTNPIWIYTTTHCFG